MLGAPRRRGVAAQGEEKVRHAGAASRVALGLMLVSLALLAAAPTASAEEQYACILEVHYGAVRQRVQCMPYGGDDRDCVVKVYFLFIRQYVQCWD